MAQITSAQRVGGLRTAPGLLERIDVPRRVVFLAAASMVAIVAMLLSFIAWQGIQLFIKDGVSVGAIFSSTWNPLADGGPQFGIDRKSVV